MAEDILIRKSDSLLELTLNRPEDGNGATDAMAEQLTQLIFESEVPVVLRGAGKDFCTGRASMGRARPTGPVEALARRNESEVIFNAYNGIRRARVPVIGVVQGRALGFGCAIAAVCDVTIASDAATFQVPEMLHNIMPTMVASALVDRVPHKALTWMIWSAETFDARLAREFGIVSQVVPAAELDAAVKKFTDRLAATPRPALFAVKEFASVALQMPLAGAIDFARNLHATINSSSEMRRPGH